MSQETKTETIKKKKRPIHPNSPEGHARIMAAIERMTWEKLDSMLAKSGEGLEWTDRNETLRLADLRDKQAERERCCAEKESR